MLHYMVDVVRQYATERAAAMYVDIMMQTVL
jgi:hypothetical protein